MASLVPVDRGNREAGISAVREAAEVMQQGINMTIYVEGHRSTDGKLLPFKKGPFYLAMETGAPVVPVSIWGTETMMKKGSVWLYPGVAHVTFHAPLFPADFATREELMDAARRSIESALPEWMWR
jgi:1-acyl-sn-glycerol-3-phosphate acyltransferase